MVRWQQSQRPSKRCQHYGGTPTFTATKIGRDYRYRVNVGEFKLLPNQSITYQELKRGLSQMEVAALPAQRSPCACRVADRLWEMAHKAA